MMRASRSAPTTAGDNGKCRYSPIDTTVNPVAQIGRTWRPGEAITDRGRGVVGVKVDGLHFVFRLVASDSI